MDSFIVSRIGCVSLIVRSSSSVSSASLRVTKARSTLSRTRHAAVILCLTHETIQRDVRQISSAALSNMHLEDFPALIRVRQIDIENLVKASLAQQLRGKIRDIVRRRNDKGRAFLLLHPCQEVPEKARCGLRAAAPRLYARERLFQGNADKTRIIMLTLSTRINSTVSHAKSGKSCPYLFLSFPESPI